MITYLVLAYCAGLLTGALIFGLRKAPLERYIKGLKEDRDCRDKYLEKLLGRWPDLPYCEDDDL